jgi:diacylglycerol kinase
LADYACKEQHPMIKKVKDIAAGAVLVSAISALIVGLLVFIPKFI